MVLQNNNVQISPVHSAHGLGLNSSNEEHHAYSVGRDDLPVVDARRSPLKSYLAVRTENEVMLYDFHGSRPRLFCTHPAKGSKVCQGMRLYIGHS